MLASFAAVSDHISKTCSSTSYSFLFINSKTSTAYYLMSTISLSNSCSKRMVCTYLQCRVYHCNLHHTRGHMIHLHGRIHWQIQHSGYCMYWNSSIRMFHLDILIKIKKRNFKMKFSCHHIFEPSRYSKSLCD